MTDFHLVQVVAGCVVEKDGRYLLVQETQKSVYGLWNLPAGRVDRGETIEAAAVREVREETGLEVALGREVALAHPGLDRPVLHAFASTITGGALHFPEDEILDARWFTLEEVRTLRREGKIRAPQWVVEAIETVAKIRDPRNESDA